MADLLSRALAQPFFRSLPPRCRTASTSFRSAAVPYAPYESRSFTPHPLRMYVKASRNNTIITLSRGDSGKSIAVTSSGTVGFRKGQREGYEAAYQVAMRTFALIEKERERHSNVQIEVLLNGFGQGRDAVYRAIMAVEGDSVRRDVVRFTDTTPIKIGGTRPKKTRVL